MIIRKIAGNVRSMSIFYIPLIIQYKFMANSITPYFAISRLSQLKVCPNNILDILLDIR